MATSPGFDDFQQSGGSLALRLKIEGWPEEFTTDPRITHGNGAGLRLVFRGLSREGVRVNDRIIMQEAKIQADGNSFRVRPTPGRYLEPTVFSLSNYPEPVARLAFALDDSETSLAGKLEGGTTLSNNTVYHLGTEAILVGTWPTITRHIWDSLPQSHNISETNESRAVYIYPRPPTMQGRRAWLYAYGNLDDGAGEGALIWMGVVTAPPRQDNDGTTWIIDAGPITNLLRQQVAAAGNEAHPIGIYHHWACAFSFQFFYNGTYSKIFHYTNIDNDEQTFIANVNALLETQRAAMSIAEIDSGKLVLAHLAGEPWSINVSPNAQLDFSIAIGSPIIGVCYSVRSHWTDSSNGDRRRGVDPGFSSLSGGAGAGAAAANRMLPNHNYFCELDRGNTNAAHASFRGNVDDGFKYDEPPVSPLGFAQRVLMTSQQDPITRAVFFTDPTAASAYPADRIYVDKDLGAAEALSISDTFNPSGFYSVRDTGVDGDGRNYVAVSLFYATILAGASKEEYAKLVMTANGFDGFLTKQTAINPIRSYANNTDVMGFVAGLKTAAIDANDGDTPQITDADLTTWAFGDSPPTDSAYHRGYQFVKAVPVEDILAEELKYIGHFMRLEDDGRIGILPLPQFSDAASVDAAHTFDLTGIVTPGQGYGAWPGWEPQRDGFINVVEIKDGYDYRQDDWDIKPPPFDDPDAVSTHKGRGKVAQTIAPKSRALAAPRDLDGYRAIAAAYLRIFATDYAVVTVQVPFKHFPVLTGDVVLLTHKFIPNGDGTRGMVARAGVVIRRAWSMDPAKAGAPGQFDVLVYLSPIVGYSPAGLVTAHTDHGGNNWTLTFDPAHAFNIEWSTANDGRVLSNFAAAMFIRLVQYDTKTPTIVTGVIAGTPDPVTGIVTVQLDGAWTPGSNGWVAGFQKNSDGAHAIDAQNKFAYGATNALVRPDGGFARRFS